jgi:hypothetical protein
MGPISSVPDPGSGAFFTLDPASGMGKKSGSGTGKSGSGSGMNNPSHFSESLETIFCVKILVFFDGDPVSGMEKFESEIRDPG